MNFVEITFECIPADKLIIELCKRGPTLMKTLMKEDIKKRGEILWK